MSEVGQDAGGPDQPERAFAQRLACAPAAGHSTTASLLDLAVDEFEHRRVEGVVGIAGYHVMRAGDIDELRMRHHFQKLTSAGFAHDAAAAAAGEEGGRVG